VLCKFTYQEELVVCRIFEIQYVKEVEPHKIVPKFRSTISPSLERNRLKDRCQLWKTTGALTRRCTSPIGSELLKSSLLLTWILLTNMKKVGNCIQTFTARPTRSFSATVRLSYSMTNLTPFRPGSVSPIHPHNQLAYIFPLITSRAPSTRCLLRLTRRHKGISDTL
jgi:hypothetical protein